MSEAVKLSQIRGTGLFLAFVCVLFNAMIAGILQQIWQCCLGKGQGCRVAVSRDCLKYWSHCNL